MGASPKAPKPLAPPAPPDETEAYFRELARLGTERELAKSRGIAGAFNTTKPPTPVRIGTTAAPSTTAAPATQRQRTPFPVGTYGGPGSKIRTGA
jgi:hypothetical protein